MIIDSRPINNNISPPLENIGHVYAAVLEQTHQLQQQPSLAITEGREETQQTMQSQLKQETLASNRQQGASDQFEQGEQSASESWASGHNSNVEPKRSSKLELIYDNVTLVEVKGEAGLVECDESLYQDHLKKHSLPANVSVLTHSTPSAWCPSSHTRTESSHTKPKRSIPVYSVPDMKKKREERKKREQSTDEYSSSKLLPPEGDQVLTVDVCLYDEPTSLSLVPKRREQPFKEGRQRERMTK